MCSLSTLTIHRNSSRHTTYVVTAIMLSRGGGHCFALHHSCTHVMPYSHVLGQSCTNLIVKHCCAFMSFNNVFRQLLLECPIVAQQLAPSEPTVALRVPTTQRRNCNPTVSTILKRRRFKLLRRKKNLYRVVW